MEIRGLRRQEVEALVGGFREDLRAQLPSPVAVRAFDRNSRTVLRVAVAGTDVIGIALAAEREEDGRRIGTVRLVVSLLAEDAVDRSVKWALLSSLESEFRRMRVDVVEIAGEQETGFAVMLERAGYRRSARRVPGLDGTGRPCLTKGCVPPSRPARAGGRVRRVGRRVLQ